MKKTSALFIVSSFLVSTAFGQSITGGLFPGESFPDFQGATVTSYSPIINNFTIDNVFDGEVSTNSASIAIFENSEAQGSVDFIEFNLSQLVTVDQYRIALGEDGGGASIGSRSASAFALYGNATGGSFAVGDLIASGSIDPDYIGAYGNNTITISGAGTATRAQFFRLELTQAEASSGTSGIRLIEFGGTVSAIPEPSSVATLVGAGALGLVLARRRR